jgi:hypothetical protein
MFRATSCSSSGESIVSIQHLVCVTLCIWPSSTQVGKELPGLHTRQSTTQSDSDTYQSDSDTYQSDSDTYQMLYWYNWFSWWWARGYSKHVENWNKHIEKRIVRLVGHLQKVFYVFFICHAIGGQCEQCVQVLLVSYTYVWRAELPLWSVPRSVDCRQGSDCN